MILKGSQRAGGAALAAHLLNEKDNDHVTVLSVDGFIAADLSGAFKEAHAVSKATRCSQYLFSLSLNPPLDHVATEADLMEAVERAEAALGLNGQPRAIVIHEKEGRRHAHAVWSRIDPATMTAINLPHYKRKLNTLAKELFLEHGHDLPNGLKVMGGKSPLNFTLAEWQQAKRQDVDPREIKQALRDAVERSDTQTSLKHALRDAGFALAKGDRRGYVVVDLHGAVYALPRWAGVKAKDMVARFGSPDDLAFIADQRSFMRSKLTDQMQSFIAQVKDRHAAQFAPLLAERWAMTALQRDERAKLKERQEMRWMAETNARADRLRSGVRGLLDRVTGRHTQIADRNAAEAWRCAQRDQDQRDGLVMSQMEDRRILQARIDAMRETQVKDRKRLARDIGQTLSRKSVKAVPPPPSKSTGQHKRFALNPDHPKGPDLSR
ncbi:MAG: relaxase/mobilization nuclease domain-containing protein [Pseudomonadota bacterium]